MARGARCFSPASSHHLQACTPPSEPAVRLTPPAQGSAAVFHLRTPVNNVYWAPTAQLWLPGQFGLRPCPSATGEPGASCSECLTCSPRPGALQLSALLSKLSLRHRAAASPGCRRRRNSQLRAPCKKLSLSGEEGEGPGGDGGGGRGMGVVQRTVILTFEDWIPLLPDHIP